MAMQWPDAPQDPYDPYSDPNYNPYLDPANYAQDPYHDPGNFAPMPENPPAPIFLEPQPGDVYGGPPANAGNVGGIPGWAPDPNDPNGSWQYTAPSAPVSQPTGEGSRMNTPGGGGYSGPMRPNYGFFRSPPAFEFQAPPAFSYDPFKPPGYNEAMNEPGYQFRVGEGRRALEQSAAGRGVLRTGGTLKDLLNYGQNLASQEYGNVYNRAYTGWNANRENAFNNYKMNYGNLFDLARAKYEPQFAGWQTEMGYDKDAADREFQRALDAYKYDNPSGSEIFGAGLG